jgi:hypothetical protein
VKIKYKYTGSARNLCGTNVEAQADSPFGQPSMPERPGTRSLAQIFIKGFHEGGLK